MTVLHKSSEYVKLLEEKNLLLENHLEQDYEVSYISYDSNDLVEGTMFICKGAHFKTEYLQASLDHGASFYVAEKKFEVEAPYLLVNDIRKAMAYIADFYYGKVWEKINLIGITGTKGKSSTAYYVKHILDDYLEKNSKAESAIISGIDNYDGVINEESHLTTPEAFALQKHFNNAVSSGIEYLTMEVSSQALKYDRTLGVTYDIGAFLNIGEDHISGIEHPDFNDYFHSKLILFGQCKTAVVNLNSDYADEILEAAKAAPDVITFGIDKEGADIAGYDVKATENGISMKVRCDAFDETFIISMRGLFNAENALAAIAITKALGIPVDSMKSGLEKAKVAGRMEVFADPSRKLDVIVDYAHNKMSFESLFQSTKKEYPDRKIYIVFGCPGKKALARRHELGSLAGKYADKVYITEEDAGEEDVMKISEEIAVHVEKYGTEWVIYPDRGEAIKKSIEDAASDAVILITGKGRETRQKRGLKYIDTPSDVEYVEEFLYTDGGVNE